MKFLLQSKNGEILHDFSFAVVESFRYLYLCWYNRTTDMTYELATIKDIKVGYIPVGSVEYVIEYLRRFYGKTPKPRNIPEELMGHEFTGRHVFNGTEKDVDSEKFVKSNDFIKSGNAGIYSEVSKGNYQISDIIDIESEWRAFVYQQELVGLSNYAGDFTIFPNVSKITEMIEAFKSAPVAYTLDIAISEEKTVIIEVNDFFSCGLYGFCDWKIYPYMLANWFYEYVK